MSQRIRAAKAIAISSISPLKSKKKSISNRKITHNPIKKQKSSPTKSQLVQSSSTLIQPKQKRLSSLTATTLLRYCTNILSPSRKVNHSLKSSSSITTKNSKQIKVKLYDDFRNVKF